MFAKPDFRFSVTQLDVYHARECEKNNLLVTEHCPVAESIKRNLNLEKGVSVPGLDCTIGGQHYQLSFLGNLVVVFYDFGFFRRYLPFPISIKLWKGKRRSEVAELFSVLPIILLMLVLFLPAWVWRKFTKRAINW